MMFENATMEMAQDKIGRARLVAAWAFSKLHPLSLVEAYERLFGASVVEVFDLHMQDHLLAERAVCLWLANEENLDVT